MVFDNFNEGMVSVPPEPGIEAEMNLLPRSIPSFNQFGEQYRVPKGRGLFAFTELDKQSDFNWFTSPQTDLSKYAGQHIAVYKKEVIGWGKTSLEAYRMAKRNKPNSKPALTYVEETADTMF